MISDGIFPMEIDGIRQIAPAERFTRLVSFLPGLLKEIVSVFGRPHYGLSYESLGSQAKVRHGLC